MIQNTASTSMNIPNSDLPRVVIIGAGFAGLQIARNIDTHQYQIVLIDKYNYHTFQPLLYQVASAGLEPDSIAYPIRKILRKKKNTYFRLTEVEHIDFDQSTIETTIGKLAYDKLIIATGATNNFFNNEAIERNSLPMKTVVDALDLRSKILGNFEKALNTKDLAKREELMNFVIVGAGPTGVELAGALAELKNKILPKDFPDLDLKGMQINLIEASDKVLAAMSEPSSEKAYQYLKQLGVQVWTNTFVTDYTDNVVTTSGKTSFKADTLVWAAGVAGTFPTGIHESEIGKGNRVIVDEYCLMKGSNNVYVVGDASLIESDLYPKGLPMLGSVAKQQGHYIAKTLNNEAKKVEAKPFIYNDQGTMATIGRNKAVVELSAFKSQGLIAWFLWMAIHLMLLVGFRNRAVVFINWAWNYINYNNGLRLIIRPFESENVDNDVGSITSTQ